MVTAKDLNDAIDDLRGSTMKLSEIIKELGNADLITIYRETAIKGLYNFCQECGLIDGYLKLEE